MSAALRLVGFVAVLGVVFGAAFVGGRFLGPDEAPVTEAHEEEHVSTTTESETAEEGPGGHEASTATLPAGLQQSQDGHTLDLATETATAGRDREIRFRILGPDGEPVTSYDVEHEKRLHLIVVRRDLTGFQHVHPTLDPATGEWSVAVDLVPGTWRVFADFKASGAEALTLGADLQVGGAFAPAAIPAEQRTATVDGFEVTLTGDVAPGADTRLTLAVSKDGRPVTDLQPYLGAYGHLVALRAGDLAYLHVHPDGEPGDGRTRPGPEIVFHTNLPTAGAYRLFLDFRHGGVVRTAEFTVHVGGHDGHPASPSAAPSDEEGEGHGH